MLRRNSATTSAKNNQEQGVVKQGAPTKQRLDFMEGITYYQMAAAPVHRKSMLKSYISQHYKETALNTCITAAILWLMIKLLVSLAQSSVVWFSSAVLVPALGLVITGFLAKYAMSLWNHIVFTQIYNNLLQSINNHNFKRLDKNEKQALVSVLTKTDFKSRLKSWIDKGYRGGYFTKKDKTKERLHNRELPPQTSSFGHQWISQLPRKIWLGFKGASAGKKMTKSLGTDNGYRDLDLELHICYNSKTAGGGKRSLFPISKDKCAAQTDTCHESKTVVGSYTVCHYTEAVGSDGICTAGVALGVRAACSSGGPLHSYSLEKSHGQSLAHMLYRRYYLRTNGLTEGDKTSKAQQITKDFVIKLLREVAQQLHPLHKRGVCHGDLKAENICVDNQQKCTVIDYPIESEDYSWTRELCQLTNTHWLLSHIVIQNGYPMTEGAEIRWTRECNIPVEMRENLESVTSAFEQKRQPRRCQQKKSDEAATNQFFANIPKNNKNYLDVSKSTLYQDTWSLLYVAFITFGELDDQSLKDLYQQRIFSIMTEMVKSYINHYNRAQKADKASIIPKMNQEWPLRDTINKVIEAPLSSKMREESHRRDAYAVNK